MEKEKHLQESATAGIEPAWALIVRPNHRPAVYLQPRGIARPARSLAAQSIQGAVWGAMGAMLAAVSLWPQLLPFTLLTALVTLTAWGIDLCRRRWEATWNGHQIVVENTALTERMWIDGKIVADNLCGGVSCNLRATLRTGGVDHRVIAHIGSIDCGTRIGCVVFVEGEPVGGDLGKRFWT